ncbi:hypothetical protein FBQ99_00430 [Chloroflexi bacterium CFX2]|nr:hypothetical protein [Chloroflexi bacterium CFX2]
MKKPFFIVSLLLALLFAIATPASMNADVSAQDPNVCYDATGAVIPCPPTQDSGGSGNNGGEDEEDSSAGGGNPPVIVNNATPSTSKEEKQDWSGKCYPSPPDKPFSFANCIAALENACNGTGGTVSIGNTEPDGGTTVSCTYGLVLEPTPLPVSSGDNHSSEAKEIGCGGSAEGVASCVGKYVLMCIKAGGKATTTVTGENSAQVSCTKDVFLEVEPTPLPFAFPEDDYLGSCTSENLAECREQFQCEDGLLVIKVDLYAGGGTQYDFYCIPHEELPDLGLPLASPADSGDNPTEYKYAGVCHFGDGYEKCISDFFAQCDADGGLYDEVDSGKDWTVATCELPERAAPTESPDIAAAPADDGSTEGSWDEECGYWTCWISALSCLMDGGSGYELDHASGAHIYHCNVPDPASTTAPPSAWLPGLGLGIVIGIVLLPAIQKVRDAAARQSSVMRQTKEHILLNKEENSKSAQMSNNNDPDLPKSESSDDKYPGGSQLPPNRGGVGDE